jgi:site-specific DNA recombinase
VETSPLLEEFCRHIEVLLEEESEVKVQKNAGISYELDKLRQDLLEQFDDDIFNELVEKLTILSPTRYLFTLWSGLEIEEFEE